VPIGHKTDLVSVQAGSNSHALRSDIAADRDECCQSISPPDSRRQPRVASGVEKVPEEVRLIIDVDQNINQLNCPQPGLDQVLCGLDGVRLILLLKRGQVKGTFRRIDSQRLVSGDALIDFCCNAVKRIIQLGDIYIRFNRQTEGCIVLSPLL
jgi:hypothetical protein